MIPKFRAWFGSEMYDEPVVYDGEFYLDWRDFEDGITYDGAVLMQSTGLFDVNGKEIFEGDVIRVNYIDDDSPWTDAIIWNSKYYAWYLKSNKELLGFAMDEPNIIVEVIGNIWEESGLIDLNNPETD
ncbi:TPA: YopX family protein [Streptococcus suis]